MVHPVHVRGDHEPAQYAVDAFGDTDVAVIEHGGGVEQYFEDQDCHGGWSQGHNHRQFDAHGEEDFDGVKASTGG